MERIIQHRKPSDVQFGVKDYLKDEWSRIPVNQKCSKATCLVCGLPTMRFVYQQQETYTAICMACGHAYRYHANSVGDALYRYLDVTKPDYQKMLHAVGLDYYKSSHRNYYEGPKDVFTFHEPIMPNWVWNEKEYQNVYHVTPEGYRFLGYDIMDEEGLVQKIIW